MIPFALCLLCGTGIKLGDEILAIVLVCGSRAGALCLDTTVSQTSAMTP